MKYTSAAMSVAKKYAQAFLNIYFSSLTNADVLRIEAAQKFLRDHQRTLFFLQLPQFTYSVRLSMVEDLMGYFGLPLSSATLFLLLIESNRAFLIPDVLLCITSLYKERNNSMDFIVTSAHELDESQKEKIKKFLQVGSGKNSMCTYLRDKKLIAGIRMQSVGYMWEYSVRKQLLCLKALEKSGTNR